MKPLPVNLLASTGNSGKAIGFILLAFAAVAILATKKPDEQPKQ